MRLHPQQCVSVLTCLLPLSRAVPSPPIPQFTPLKISSADASLLNFTLAAVIPADFTITPSLPLDEPVLNARNTLILTLHALGRLGVDDFEEEQRSQTWRSLQHVSIDILGPSKVVESSLPMRKYALWGIYKAIHLMVAHNDFRSRNYELYSQEALVGYVGFNNGVYDTLSNGNGTKDNATGRDSRKRSLSVVPTTLANATMVDPGSVVTFAFELNGRTIGQSNVFMTLFTGILKAAPYSKAERVQAFFLNSVTFNTYLSFTAREDPGPEGPFFEYEQLIQVLGNLPTWVMAHGNRWTEADMVVSIDDVDVGAGFLRWQVREGVGVVDGGDVTTS